MVWKLRPRSKAARPEKKKKKKEKEKEIRTHNTSRMHGHKGTGGHENAAVCAPGKEISGDTTMSTP